MEKAGKDFEQYKEYAKIKKDKEKEASSLSDESNRMMGSLSYLAGKKVGDNAEASRKKRLSMADEEAQYASENAQRKMKDYRKSDKEAYDESRKLEDVNKKNKWKGTM